MADICIIYACEDRSTAAALSRFLSDQWTVWWDDTLAGDFRTKIPAEIKQARCIVAVWSVAANLKTGTVGEDMQIALDNKVEIIPVVIEDCEPMYGFRNLSRVDLQGWQEDSQHPNFLQLKRKLANLVPPRAKPLRPATLSSGHVHLPALFLSVSSHETRLDPLPAVLAAKLFGSPLILISAYDTLPGRCPEELPGLLREYRQNGGFLLMDSGNYEASRRGDKEWCPVMLKQALHHTPPDWAFCFDDFPAPEDVDAAIEHVISAVERDQSYTEAPMLPIVHTSRRADGSYDFEKFPELVYRVSEKLVPQLIAVPERELGAGLLQRAQTVRKIREKLDRLPFYQPLHLLGTGNPWTISILTAAGADTFDGLEWCRTVVDHDSGRLHHDQHFDFFSYQGRRENSSIATQVLDDPAINFAGKVAFHNMTYYSIFSKELIESTRAGNLEALATGMLGRSNMIAIKKAIPEIYR